MLICLRSKDRTECEDYENDLSEIQQNIKSLKECIDKNIKIEPKWAQNEFKNASKLLFGLAGVMDREFIDDSSCTAGVKFAAACNCGVYKEFCGLLDELSEYWPKWKKER